MSTTSESSLPPPIQINASTFAHIIFLGSCPISWSSKKQRSIARSSTEAEYRALTSCSAEILWLSNLLSEFRISLPSTPTLSCDNLSATYLSVNPVFHSRMKHIAIDYHFVRQHVSDGSFKVSYISTHYQLADVLTKSLPPAKYINVLRSKIGVSNGSSILRGPVRENGTAVKESHTAVPTVQENRTAVQQTRK